MYGNAIILTFRVFNFCLLQYYMYKLLLYVPSLTISLTIAEFKIIINFCIRYKFWSCCHRRTCDFDEFLKQEGCVTGSHVWFLTDEVRIYLCLVAIDVAVTSLISSIVCFGLVARTLRMLKSFALPVLVSYLLGINTLYIRTLFLSFSAKEKGCHLQVQNY